MMRRHSFLHQIYIPEGVVLLGRHAIPDLYLCSGAWETASTAVGGCEASVARLPQADGGPAAAGEDLPGSIPELPDGGSMGHKTQLRRPV